MAALCALAMVGTTTARGQQDNATRTKTAQDANARVEAAAGGRDVGHDTLIEISHALSMAIEGSTLQAMSGNAGQGQGGALAQLQQHARKQFDASDQLFREAGRGMAAGGGEPIRTQSNRGRNELTGSPAMRLYTASNEYASTLRRIVDRGAQAASRPGANDRPAADQARPAGAVNMADVALINHGLCEVLDAFRLNHTVRMMGDTSRGGRELHQHAQQMDSDGRSIIKIYATQFGLNRGAGAGANAANPGGANAAKAGGANAANPGGANAANSGGADSSPVGTLAFQANEIVSALQDLGNAARGNERPAQPGQGGTRSNETPRPR